ncbi:MAG: peptidylprolyl isomerase [bacterium]
MTGYKWILTGCMFMSVLVGCKEKEKVAPGDLPVATVVAIVNGKQLLFGEMSKRADGYLKYAREEENLMFASNMLGQAKEFYRKKAIETFIYKTVMLDEAVRMKIVINENERTLGLQQLAFALSKRNSTTNAFFNQGPQAPEIMRRDFEDGLVIEKLLSQEVQKKIRISDKEVEEVAATIAVTNELKHAKLEMIRKQIVGGAAFEDVAKTVSECASAKKGGDLGEFGRGKMDKAFEEVVFKLKVGEISPVFETKYGYHIVKVVAHNKAQPAKNAVPAVPETVRASHILLRRLSDDRTKIATLLYKTHHQRGAKQMFDDLRAQAKIECSLFPGMASSENNK